MKRFRKVSLVLLTVLAVSSAFPSVGSPQASRGGRGGWGQATEEEFNMADVLIARPLGIVAGIIGTGIFIVSLPFTIPTHSVNEAAQMFVVDPFKFSFEREFPDENIAAQPVPPMYD
jgi:hypothetical protein